MPGGSPVNVAKKQWVANMVFVGKKSKRGKKVMGISDGIDLIDDDIRKEKHDLEKAAAGFLYKYN